MKRVLIVLIIVSMLILSGCAVLKPKTKTREFCSIKEEGEKGILSTVSEVNEINSDITEYEKELNDLESSVSDVEGEEKSAEASTEIKEKNKESKEEKSLQKIVINETEKISLKPKATDPDTDKLKYYFSAPLDEKGEWQTDYDDAGKYRVTITASDGKLNTTKDILIIVNNVNRAPVLESIKNITTDENKTIEFKLKATDPDKENLTITTSKLPQGSSFEDGKFNWKTDFNQAGTYEITFTASDGNLKDSETVKIVVNNVNRNPELEKISDKTVNENEELIFKVGASDPDNDKISFNTTGIPKGAQFKNNEFKWKPSYDVVTEEGNKTFEVTFAVKDELNGRDSETVKITVNNVNRAPVIEEISLG